MPKKTKKEYETVEKTIKYTECDVPGCFNTDENKELIELAVNPRYKSERWKEPTIIEQVGDLQEAEEWVSEQKYKNQKMNRSSDRFNSFDDNDYAYGYAHRETTKEAKSDTKFHVCQHCLKKHFEAVPDRYNPEKVTEIETNTGRRRVVITQEVNPVLSFPDWLLAVWMIVSLIIFLMLLPPIL